MDWSKLKYRHIWLPILYSLTIACWDTPLFRTRVSHVGAIWKASVKTTYIISQSSYTYHSTGEAEALGLNYPPTHSCRCHIKSLEKAFKSCTIFLIPHHTIPHHTTLHNTIPHHTVFVSLEILAKYYKGKNIIICLCFLSNKSRNTKRLLEGKQYRKPNSTHFKIALFSVIRFDWDMHVRLYNLHYLKYYSITSVTCIIH